MLIGRPIEYEIRMPVVSGPAGAVAEQMVDHHPGIQHAHGVQGEAQHAHVVEHDVLCMLDVDAVLAADDRHVPQGDVIRTDADPSLHDAADERLGMADHERPAHGPVQVNGRRPNRVGPAEPADHDDRDRARRERTGSARFAARLRVLEPKARQEPVREDLRGEPTGGVEEERKPQRRGDGEVPHSGVDDRQLEQAERHR